MSNNVATNTKNEGRCSFSRKALSVATAAVLATTMVPMLPAESAWANDDATALASEGVLTTAGVSGVTVSGSYSYSFGAQPVTGTITLSQAAGAGNYVNIQVKDGTEVIAEGTAVSTGTATITYSIDAVLAPGSTSYKVVATSGASSSGTAEQTINVTDSGAAANAAWQLATVTVNAEKDADDEYWFDESLNPVDFKVTSVVDKVSGKTLGMDDYRVAYRTKGQTAETATAPNAEGSYEMLVYPAGDLVKAGATYQFCSEPIVIPFFIGDATVSTDMTLFQANGSDYSNTADTDFYWTGSSFNALASAGIVVNGAGKELKLNSGSITAGDYYIATVNGNSTSGYGITSTGVGTYRLGIAKAADNNASGDQVLCYLDLEVKPFDLSKATFVIKDKKYDSGNTNVAAADVTVKIGNDVLDSDQYTATNLLGTQASKLKAFAKVTAFEPAKGAANPGVSGELNALGKYTIELAASTDAGNKEVTGAASTTVNVVSNVADSFKYDGQTFADWNAGTDNGTTDNGLIFDKAAKESFDASKIAVKVTSPSKTLKADEYTVTVYDAEGNVVTDWSKIGKYTAVVQVNVDGRYEMGGTATLDFEVINGASDSIVFAVDGKVVTGNTSVVYDGKAVDLFCDVKITSGDKTVTLVEGTDYKVVIKKDGKEVDEIKDYGTYTVSVESDTYTFANGKNFTVTVNDLAITDAAVEQGEYEVYGSEGKTVEGILWTGSAITPVVKYKASAASKDYDTVLPAEAYTATYKFLANADEDGVIDKDGNIVEAKADWKTVAAEDVKDAGYYKMTVSDVASDKNYSVNIPGELSFRIVKNVSFSDVASDAWYAPEVAKAVENNYITGLAGTTLFVPEANITRADTSLIIYRMATGKIGTGSEAGSGSVTFPSVFDDVKGNEYYAEAVNWATKAGVVSGYDGTELFGPNDNASREQIATMLYRYAKVMGKDLTVSDEAAALAKYSDGASVSEYAKTAMAWCVEQGIFGVNTDTLRPQDNMSRAEMAATAVRVQPKAVNA